jgi:hypothetical protein
MARARGPQLYGGAQPFGIEALPTGIKACPDAWRTWSNCRLVVRAITSISRFIGDKSNARAFGVDNCQC